MALVWAVSYARVCASLAGTAHERRLAEWTDPCEGTSGSGGGEPDHSILTSVLQRHVRQGEINGIRTSVVDYSALRQDPTELRRYLEQFCDVNVTALSTAQSLAVHINAYNAWMIAIVLAYSPAASVLELSARVPEGSIWKHKFGTIGGVKVSQDDIEHGRIRGGLAASFGGPGRIHAAVNCASASCPDLLSEAFDATSLSSQLDAATRGWLENPTKNPGLVGGGLQLSKIFSWYGQDFVQDSGSVQAFVKKYNTAWDIVTDSTAVSFADYDWNLNAANATGTWSDAAPRAPRGVLAAAVVAALITVA